MGGGGSSDASARKAEAHAAAQKAEAHVRWQTEHVKVVKAEAARKEAAIKVKQAAAKVQAEKTAEAKAHAAVAEAHAKTALVKASAAEAKANAAAVKAKSAAAAAKAHASMVMAHAHNISMLASWTGGIVGGTVGCLGVICVVRVCIGSSADRKLRQEKATEKLVAQQQGEKSKRDHEAQMLQMRQEHEVKMAHGQTCVEEKRIELEHRMLENPQIFMLKMRYDHERELRRIECDAMVAAVKSRPWSPWASNGKMKSMLEGPAQQPIMLLDSDSKMAIGGGQRADFAQHSHISELGSDGCCHPSASVASPPDESMGVPAEHPHAASSAPETSFEMLGSVHQLQKSEEGLACSCAD